MLFPSVNYVQLTVFNVVFLPAAGIDLVQRPHQVLADLCVSVDFVNLKNFHDIFALEMEPEQIRIVSRHEYLTVKVMYFHQSIYPKEAAVALSSVLLSVYVLLAVLPATPPVAAVMPVAHLRIWLFPFAAAE
jgi:hypothetical protein